MYVCIHVRVYVSYICISYSVSLENPNTLACSLCIQLIPMSSAHISPLPGSLLEHSLMEHLSHVAFWREFNPCEQGPFSLLASDIHSFQLSQWYQDGRAVWASTVFVRRSQNTPGIPVRTSPDSRTPRTALWLPDWWLTETVTRIRKADFPSGPQSLPRKVVLSYWAVVGNR